MNLFLINAVSPKFAHIQTIYINAHKYNKKDTKTTLIQLFVTVKKLKIQF